MTTILFTSARSILNDHINIVLKRRNHRILKSTISAQYTYHFIEQNQMMMRLLKAEVKTVHFSVIVNVKVILLKEFADDVLLVSKWK